MDNTIFKFKKLFLEEASRLLNSCESDLLLLENKPSETSIIDSIFRSMHTLKGTSGMYGFTYINELTHDLESIFQEIRDGRMEFNKTLFDLTFSSIDHIRKLLSDELLSNATLRQEHNTLIKSIQEFSNVQPLIEVEETQNNEPVKNETALWHILLNTTEEQYFRGINFTNLFMDLAELGQFSISKVEKDSSSKTDTWSITLRTNSPAQEISDVFLFVEDDCIITQISKNLENIPNIEEISISDAVNTIGNPKNNSIPETSQKSVRKNNIRRITVDSTKLDYLMFLVSELITLNSQFSLSIKENNGELLQSSSEKLNTLSKQFRTSALELQLVPLNEMTLRFQRLIRDLSKSLGKKIDFQCFGTDVEVDKSIIDKLSDPLVHIIRNCIDHGIELPEKRVKQGKAETGVIKLSAQNNGTNIYIKVEDDGNGIEPEKIRKKAESLGLLKPTDILEEKELINFIFKPGFSTAQNLSSISGRGVGMDVVRSKIHELRGEVYIDSKKGKGTVFTLELQQSISIIDTLLFKTENTLLTIPIANISSCMDISDSELESHKHTATIAYEDSFIPLVNTREILGLNGCYEKKIKLIVFRNNESMIGILADKIIGEHQAVIKPLTKTLRRQRYLNSASQLGDGSMAFMLDTGELIKGHSINSIIS